MRNFIRPIEAPKTWSVDTDKTIRRLSWATAWLMPIILTIAVCATIPLPF